MTVEDNLIAIVSSVIATLIASGLIWVFRRQLGQALVALDMPAGAVFAWVMAFIVLAVFIVFPLIDREVPGILESVLVMLLISLAMTTFSKRR